MFMEKWRNRLLNCNNLLGCGFLQSVGHVWFHFATTTNMPYSNYNTADVYILKGLFTRDLWQTNNFEGNFGSNWM